MSSERTTPPDVIAAAKEQADVMGADIRQSVARVVKDLQESAAKFGTIKHSITVPADISKAVTAAVPQGEFSAYVSLALRNQLERDARAALLQEMETEHGPVDADEYAALIARLS